MFPNYTDSCEKCGKVRPCTLMAAQRITPYGVNFVCYYCWYKPESWWHRLWWWLFRGL